MQKHFKALEKTINLNYKQINTYWQIQMYSLNALQVTVDKSVC